MNDKMKDKIPMEEQVVEVCLANSEWQPATFKGGEFVDAYGLPLDRQEISNWRPAKTVAANTQASNRIQ